MSLFKKELRQLMPLGWLVGIMWGGGLILFPLTERIDEFSWANVNSGLLAGNGGLTAGALVFLSLIVGFSLFPREHDDGTIDFLYSLPISRWRIYGIKLLSGLTLLGFGVVLEQLSNWILQLPNQQSMLGDQFDLRMAAEIALLEFGVCIIALSHLVLLSFFRRFGLLIYGIFFWLIVALSDTDPFVRNLDYSRLLNLTFSGQHILIPWPHLFFHLFGAGICFIVAGLLWLTPSDRFAQFYRALFKKRGGKVLLVSTSIATTVVVIGLMVQMADDDGTAQESGPIYAGFTTAAYKTEHYHFTYPSNLRNRSIALIEQADQLYRQVSEALNFTSENPIVADLTEQSHDHLGIAGWTKIRMDVTRNSEPLELRRVLHHETVHVLADQLANGRLGRHGKFFSEGLADYLSFRAVNDKAGLDKRKLVAAIAWQRQQIRIEELVDDDALAARYDPDLVYHLGEFWINALVHACGPKAPGKILTQIGNPDAIKHLSGMVFWQAVVQAANCDLTAVNRTWLALLERFSTDKSDLMRKVPQPHGSVTKAVEGAVVLVVEVALLPEIETVQLYLRVRADRNARRNQYYTAVKDLGERKPETDSDQDAREPIPYTVTFEIPRNVLTSRRFEYQLGVETGITNWPCFGRWRSGLVPE